MREERPLFIEENCRGQKQEDIGCFCATKAMGSKEKHMWGARSSLEQLQVAWRRARQEHVLVLELEVVEHGFSAKTDLQPLRDF